MLAERVSKTFTVPVRGSGVLGSLRALVRPEHVARTVVDDVSFAVRRGEFVALLGPNGAGKSTLIKMLTGIIVPSSGEVRVGGRVPHADRVANAREIGAVFGQRTQLWWELPAVESLNILRDIYDIPKAAHAARLREFSELLELDRFWHTPVRQLSLGQRVRCDLAAALIHDPPTVFLDEPTIGMDLVVKERVREFLRHQVAERGRTIILTTHDMAEVAHLCDRLVLISAGRLAFDGTLARLRAAHGGGVTVRVWFAYPVEELVVPGAVVVERSPSHAVLVAEPGTDHREVVRALVSAGAVTDLRIEEVAVEDLVRDLYQAQPVR